MSILALSKEGNKISLKWLVQYMWCFVGLFIADPWEVDQLIFDTKHLISNVIALFIIHCWGGGTRLGFLISFLFSVFGMRACLFFRMPLLLLLYNGINLTYCWVRLNQGLCSAQFRCSSDVSLLQRHWQSEIQSHHECLTSVFKDTPQWTQIDRDLCSFCSRNWLFTLTCALSIVLPELSSSLSPDIKRLRSSQ